MRSFGIVQGGDPRLWQVARPPFVLPAEAEEARRISVELNLVLDQVAAVHRVS